MNQMSNKNCVAEVLEKRRETLKKTKEKEKERIIKEEAAFENLIQLILNVFKASDEDSPLSLGDSLVWKIRLEMDEKLKIQCSVCFFKEGEISYYHPNHHQIMFEKMANLKSAIKVLEAVEITRESFNRIYDYFIDIPGYTAKQVTSCIKIMMDPYNL